MKRAFTLAEVLITLGIIGVVAAMTIPTLMANMKYMRFRTQFQKGISTLNQAVRMNMAQHDWNFADINTSSDKNDNPAERMSIGAIINGNMSGVTKVHFDYSIASSSSWISNLADYNSRPDYLVEYLAKDGMYYVFHDYGFFWHSCTKNPNMTWEQAADYHGEAYTGVPDCDGFIDVNGSSLPNKEVTCSDGTVKYIWDADYKDCIVDNKTIGDVFPIIYHDDTIEPATNAARYVLNSKK